MLFDKKFLWAAGALAMMAGALLSTKANAVDSNLTMDAVIIAPLTINCTGAGRALNFGSIDPNGGGTVTVTPAGGSSTTGPVLLAATGLQQGVCDLTGEGTLAFTVSIPADSVDDVGAGAPMAVTNFQIDDGTGVGASPYASSLVAGAQSVSIGADLAVAGGQLAGTYTGTVIVTAAYQ